MSRIIHQPILPVIFIGQENRASQREGVGEKMCGISHLLGVSVMGSVISAPPSGRAFHARGTHGSQVDLQSRTCFIRRVRPQAVVSGGDAEPGVEVEENSEHGRLQIQGGEVGADAAHERDEDDEVGAQPIDVLVPVAPCYGIFGDVRLLQVILAGPQRLVVLGAVVNGIGGGNAHLGCARGCHDWQLGRSVVNAGWIDRQTDE